MMGALALVAALSISSQIQTHPAGLDSIGPSRGRSLRTAPIMDKLYQQANKPALDFNFARFKDLHDDATGKTSLVTFSRSAAQSPGTYVGADGLIHDAAVNLALYSEQLDQWGAASGATVSANQTTAPDGKQTADEITNISGGYLQKTVSTIVSGQTYTLSFFLKAGTTSLVRVQAFGGGSYWMRSDFDLSSGTVSSVLDGTASIENVGNGWYRCSVTGVVSTTSIVTYIVPQSSGTHYAWGAQLEETDPATMEPTAYIHTTSQALAAPRFDHTPTTGNVTTNLLTYSEMLDVSPWSNLRSTITANDSADPFGGTSAEKLEQQSGQTTSGLIQRTETTTGTHTFSIYAKSNGKNKIFLQTGSYTNRTWFDLASGTVGTTAANHTSTSISDVGNSWYRVSVTFSISITADNFGVGLADTDGSITVADSGGLYLYGAQLEAAPSAGPYVRTLSETRSISDAVAPSLGLLVEEQRANAITESEFRNGYAAVASAAGGLLTNTDFEGLFYNSGVNFGVDGATTSYLYMAGATASTTNTFSVFVRMEDGGPPVFGSPSSGSSLNDFVLILGGSAASPTTYTVEDYGNDLYRVSATRLYGTSGTYNGVVKYGSNSSRELTISGYQIENSASFPTSYIPTTGSSQTRYADIAAVQDEDFSTTNLLAYSESFDVGWSSVRLNPVTPNAATAPDGQTTADYIEQASGQTNAGGVFQATTIGGISTLSVYAKASEKTWVRLHYYPTSGPLAYFNLSTCQVGTTQNSALFASAEDAGDGWCRISMGFNASISQPVFIYLADADNSATVTDSGGIYLWGASLTQTEYPVAYTTTRNLLTDSQDFERASWVKASGATIDDDVAQAPDGTLTADRINFTASLSRIEKPILFESATYVASVWLRTESGTRTVGIRPGSGTPQDVTVTTTWQRFSFSDSVPAGTRYPTIISNTASTDPVLAWGFQVEPGTTATDYVRTVDTVGKAYGFFEPTEGTVFGETEAMPAANFSRLFMLGESGSNYVLQVYNSSSTAWRYIKSSDGALLTIGTDTGPYSLSVGYKLDDYGSALNGLTGDGDTSTNQLAGASKLTIGRGDSASTGILNGHIRRLTYWPRRQADSTLQVITQ